MPVTIAHLGPSGTNTESAALQYAEWLAQTTHQQAVLDPHISIAQTLKAVAQGEVDFAVVPVENSIEGSVTMTLDTFWQRDQLQIQAELVLPIVHALLSEASEISSIQTVYSHPQALSQCQEWLELHLPNAQLVPMKSTTEALEYLRHQPDVGAIASQRAAKLYDLPILACPINDYPDNCTRFWVVNTNPSQGGSHTSIAFTVHDVPGALVKPLQTMANRQINMRRIESRPSKRVLGDYLFFVDLAADIRETNCQETLAELLTITETLRVLGSYNILPMQPAT